MGLLVLRNAPGQLGTGTAGVLGHFQDAAPQKSGYELQFVRRQAEQETAGASLQRSINTRNQGSYQTASHGRSPVGEKPYQNLGWIWPYYGENRLRVQGGSKRLGSQEGSATGAHCARWLILAAPSEITKHDALDFEEEVHFL